MDKQDKIWDDVLGFLAWKFKQTDSGDMYIESDRVISELKDKYFIKTYESFIQEGFGAITMSDDTSMYNPITPPDVKKPSMMNTSPTGITRIPSHWNNSPFMSGSVYGTDAAYAIFGSNPDDTKKNLEDALKSNIESIEKHVGVLDNINRIGLDAYKISPVAADEFDIDLEAYSIEDAYTDKWGEEIPGTWEVYVDRTDDNAKILDDLGFTKDEKEMLYNKLVLNTDLFTNLPKTGYGKFDKFVSQFANGIEKFTSEVEEGGGKVDWPILGEYIGRSVTESDVIMFQYLMKTLINIIKNNQK